MVKLAVLTRVLHLYSRTTLLMYKELNTRYYFDPKINQLLIYIRPTYPSSQPSIARVFSSTYSKRLVLPIRE